MPPATAADPEYALCQAFVRLKGLAVLAMGTGMAFAVLRKPLPLPWSALFSLGDVCVGSGPSGHLACSPPGKVSLFVRSWATKGVNELRIDLTDFENQNSFAKYGSFRVAAQSDQYRLTLGNFVEGSADDSLYTHNNMPFSTRDKQQDPQKFNCAEKYKGGWWYNDCHFANLNGKYWLGEHDSYADGINWRTGRGFHYSYKHTEMKFRSTT